VKRDTKIVGGFLAAIPVIILGLSTLCTWAIAHGAAMNWRLLFRMLCHGIIARSFTLFDVPMPICARCTGIYIGLFAGLVAFMLFPRIEERLARYSMYAAAVPMAVDGLTQALGLRESFNALRVATGFVAAFAFGIWVLSAVEQRDMRAFTTS
jgi:uncharacterized membrane protein